MPLVGSDAVLSTALQAAMVANPAIKALPGPALEGLCTAIATAVLAHIVANAVVTTAGTASAQVGTVG